MDVGKELESWLDDPKDKFPDRVEYAIRVWEAVNFNYEEKFETIINWLGRSLANETACIQMERLFRLSGQPGLVTVASKERLLCALAAQVAKQKCSTFGPQLLQSLLNFEIMQDALRANFDLTMRAYSAIFACYESFVQPPKVGLDYSAQPLLKGLLGYIQKVQAQNKAKIRDSYNKLALKSLVQLILQLRACDQDFFEDFAAIEQQITEDLDHPELLARCKTLPRHVHLLTLESATVNRRNEEAFVKLTVQHVFSKFLQETADQTSPKLTLGIAAYTLETWRRHDISLQFHVEEERELQQEEPDELLTALQFVGKQLRTFVRLHKESHLREVLILVGSAMRLNPLVLERHIYQIAVWLWTTPKKDGEEHQLYVEFLVLLLDMFKRLSRTERFIMNLLKGLHNWLFMYKLSPACKRLAPAPEEAEAVENGKEEVAVVAKKPRLSREPLDYMNLLLVPYKHELSKEAAALPLPNDAFARLYQTWPSQTVGMAFSQLVGSLLSKQAIVVWKTLLHALDDLLDDTKEILKGGNLDYSIELHSAMLCQFFMGHRLAENFSLHLNCVNAQRTFTGKTIAKLNHMLIKQEYNRRTMNAFLEVVIRATGFDMMLSQYWPDGFKDAPTRYIFDFLTPEEWTVLRQRVYNFGRQTCRERLAELDEVMAQSTWLQRLTAAQPQHPFDNKTKHTVESLAQLSRAEKHELMATYRMRKYESVFFEDSECVEAMVLHLIETFAYTVSRQWPVLKKTSVICCLKFEEVMPVLDEKGLIKLANYAIEHRNDKLTDWPVDKTNNLMASLRQYNFKHLELSIKTKLWLIMLVLYRDFNHAPNNSVEAGALQLFDILTETLVYGPVMPICTLFPDVSKLNELLPPQQCWPFWEFLLQRCVKRGLPGTDEFLTNCVTFVQEQAKKIENVDKNMAGILFECLEVMHSVSGPQAKRLLKHLPSLLEAYKTLLQRKFEAKELILPKTDQEFVRVTNRAFPVYMNSLLNKHKKQDKTEEEEEPVQIDENFQKLAKTYIGHSMVFRNPHGVRLIHAAFTHRRLLKLDQNEIEFILNAFWTQIIKDCRELDAGQKNEIEAVEGAVKLIVDNKTNEDFMIIMKKIGKVFKDISSSATEQEIKFLLRNMSLVSIISKCSMSTVKGTYFDGVFENICCSITYPFVSKQSNMYRRIMEHLFEAQRNMAYNRTIPMNFLTLDRIFSTMLAVDIKNFIDLGGSWNDFKALHLAMSETLLVLVRQRGSQMAEVAQHLPAVALELALAIICYGSFCPDKNNNNNNKQQQQKKPQGQSKLTREEWEGLAELSVKLAAFTDALAQNQAVAVKRMSPITLVGILKAMVQTDRPTTLRESIKTPINAICHHFISLCDHRSRDFIMRSSSEACCRLYQSLVKDHEKSYKFKGKV